MESKTKTNEYNKTERLTDKGDKLVLIMGNGKWGTR